MTLFVADENVDYLILTNLREQGYSVESIAEQCPSLKDSDVLQWALERQAVLLTEDKDFGELVFRQRKVNSGIVLYRLAGLTSQQKAERIVQAFTTHSNVFSGRFTVISSDQVRVRPNLSIS